MPFSSACDGTEANSAAVPKYDLTPREREIFALVVSGCSNKDAAQRLELSVETVKHRLTSVFDKVGVSSRLELALFAAAHGLLEASPGGEPEPASQAR